MSCQNCFEDCLAHLCSISLLGAFQLQEHRVKKFFIHSISLVCGCTPERKSSLEVLMTKIYQSIFAFQNTCEEALILNTRSGFLCITNASHISGRWELPGFFQLCPVIASRYFRINILTVLLLQLDETCYFYNTIP